MIPRLTYSDYQPQVYHIQTTLASHSTFYEIATAIFRVSAMALQYIVVKVSVTFRHWHWFPSALPHNNVKVSSRNIANINALPKCLATAWNPCSRSLFQEIGPPQGLRVTSDIIFRPASGLCLGKSFLFLSEYLFSKEREANDRLINAALAVQEDIHEKSVELQAIYDFLIGAKGTVISKEKNSRTRNDMAHQAILQAMGHYLHLDVKGSIRLSGNISSIREQLETFETGNYFIQFALPQHTIVFVKAEGYIALFEPNEGLAIFEGTDQQRGLSQLLEYYESNDMISLKLVAIRTFNKQDNH